MEQQSTGADAPPTSNATDTPPEVEKNKGGRPKGSKNSPADTRIPKTLKLDKVRFKEMPHVSHVGNSNTVTSGKPGEGELELDTALRVIIWRTGRNIGTVIVPLEGVEFCTLAAKE